MQSSRNSGSIQDGSASVIGAERVLVNSLGTELVETVTEWSNKKMYYSCSIDKGAPPFAKSMIITFRVREQKDQVLVDMIVDLEVKCPFIVLSPILGAVLPKKLGGFVEGISDLKE